MKKINFFETTVAKNANKLICKTLNSTFLSEGKKVKEFEERLTDKFNLKNLLTVNSGTSALHLSLILAEVGKGDEVIIPAQTFVATGLAVLYTGAIPVFADINKESGNISPDSIRKMITKKTKAIIPVHWGGIPCDMDEIKKIGQEFDLRIIEDAAHALGSLYKGDSIGTISDYTCFSFQAIKHLTTSDGGAISINDVSKFNEGKRRRWFGMDRQNSNISFTGERDCDISELGYKYHMNDLSATLGIANILEFDMNFNKRLNVAHQYNSLLNNFSGIKLFSENYDYKRLTLKFEKLL